MLGNEESQGAETLGARPPAKSVVYAFGVIITDTKEVVKRREND